jgi:hypothetical protein
MRWLRLYDDTINDPKILKLPEAMRWHWIAMLCIASKNEGALPTLDDISIQLRVTAAKATEIIAALVKAGLLDKTETGFAPHNWNGRQYKSDVSNERVKRYRQRKRNVTVTPPDTETETESSEADASGAEAPTDHRKRLFSDGLSKLASMTGKGPDACRSFVGKCLKAASDDAITVLGLIEDAERNQVVDPSAWIAARLKGPENGKTGSKIIQAADDLRRKIASFDGPPSRDQRVRGPEGAPVIGLLSNR